MELKIGENIKRLRTARGLTQEQLAELLCVSGAAVSKWEKADTYPDIGMLFPLARIFGVSVDTLMGYDTACVEANIEAAFAEYRRLRETGRFDEARACLLRARRDFPNDYRVMLAWLQHLIGGRADNDSAVLNANRGEITQLCRAIREGCPDEQIRREALYIQAKLHHAAGDTPAALELLAGLSNWYETREQLTEQLYAKDTAEYRAQVGRNLYALADFAADKLVKVIWYDEPDCAARAVRAEAAGDGLMALWHQTGEIAFLIAARQVYGRLYNNLLYADGDSAAVTRIWEKEYAAAQALTGRAKADHGVAEWYTHRFGTDDMPRRMYRTATRSERAEYAALRSDPDFTAMLARHRPTEE